MTVSIRRLFLACVCAFAATACGSRQSTIPTRPLDLPAGDRTIGDASAIYHSMGRAAAAAPVPFVGAVAYFAGATPDSTLTLVTLSIPNRGLTFVREGDRYRGSYGVQLRLTRAGAEVHRVDAIEIVRVGAFREIGRIDESVVFHRWLRVAPGNYTLRMQVRDIGSTRAASDTLVLTVPQIPTTTLSTALPVYEAAPRSRVDSIPALVARPRSSAVFGRDSVVGVYVEAYRAGASASLPLRLMVRNDAGVAVFHDTVSLARRGSFYSGTVGVPVARVGLGAASATFARLDFADSSTTPLFVTFGDDLPVAPFEEMVSYLRFFASGSRLRALREAAPERRAQLWAQFLAETDPTPGTPEHEDLQAYFARIQLANARFREDGPIGWLSDRGMVFVALGEPDQAFQQTVQTRQLASGFGRIEVWEYRQWRAQLVFNDTQQGSGRFRLTPQSEAEFRSILQRKLAR